MIDDQQRDAAAPVLLADRAVDDLLGDVEAVEMHHAGRTAGDRRLDEIGRQPVLPVRHFDELDRLAPRLEPLGVDLDAALVGDQPARILVARHALGQQIVEAGAQIFAAGRKRMVRLRIDVAEALDPLGELHQALEPGVLRGGIVLARRDLLERPARLVDLGNLAAPVERAHDGEVPGIVVGEILEHRFSLRQDRQRLLRLQADPLDDIYLPAHVLLRKRANSSGVEPIARTPLSASTFFSSGVSSALTASRWISAMRSRGVRAGNHRPK